MPRRYRPEEVEKVLEYLGWELSRQRGSHRQFIRPGQRGLVTVPASSRALDQGTLGNIVRQAGLTRREFETIATEVL
jgi:predicted RNA binding protein YcfA (HicA-like mRNA interferase family)